MNKNAIMIKGNKYGIVVVMDSEVPFEDIKTVLAEKLTESAKFFGSGTMAISFEGRVINDDERRELLDVISQYSELNIACVIDQDEHIIEVFKKSVEKIQNLDDNNTESFPMEPVMEEMIKKNEKDGNTGKFYRGTLRSGQVLESDTSIVIIGDVNPGAKVVAGGNVIILGSLKGTVSAGISGDTNAFIVALDMAPVQVRIGETIARCSEKPKKGKAETKIAYLDDGNIFIDPLSKNILNELKF